ncbi:hypothetical protein MLD38_020286 [Melastoma candidum]|uniref:Uncharacterized protein n=1 Tax=Melastoma candidum TaxID=119954 RepID=A0ACB9QCR8_9MYRT|nr:hypothetical protein MLD38_020286 [Melastoma candidum]
MENMMGSAEFLTVVAVSGGVAYIAVQAHKRLLSDFMDKIHSRFEGEGQQQRRSWAEKKAEKKVHFAGDVAEPSSNNRDYRRRRRAATGKSSGQVDQMPMNRQVLYRGIMKQKTLLPQAG